MIELITHPIITEIGVIITSLIFICMTETQDACRPLTNAFCMILSCALVALPITILFEVFA